MHATGFDHRPEDRDEIPIDLDGGDHRADFGEGKGQRSEAGADLDDLGSLGHAGQADDAPEGVRIDDEVLPECPTGPEPVLTEEAADVRSGPAHHEMVTVATPWLGSASCEKPQYDRSTTRPGLSASRSSTTQVTDAPFVRSTTVSSVPNGSHGLAHPSAGASGYQVATPVDVSGVGVTRAVVVVVVGVTGAVVVVVVGATSAAVVVVVGATLAAVVDGVVSERPPGYEDVVDAGGRVPRAGTAGRTGWPGRAFRSDRTRRRSARAPTPVDPVPDDPVPDDPVPDVPVPDVPVPDDPSPRGEYEASRAPVIATRS
jgi:hypothetical protein